MPESSTGLPALLAKPAAALVILVAGIGLALGICLSIQVIPLVLGFACFVLLIALSRLRTADLLLAYVMADHLCQFLKRAIFTLGPEPMVVYYGFQLLPTLVLCAAVASSLYALRKTQFPLSAKLLGLFILISLAQTFVSPNGSDMFSRFGGVNEAIIPLFIPFAAMSFAPSDWRRLAKLLLVLIIISSIYGVVQLIGGPTVVDRAWALQTGDYSIQGSEVFSYLTGGRTDFRPYSYYSDPGSWGYFLVLATLFLVALRQRGPLPPMWLKVAVGFSLVGMAAAQTRSVWVALFGALIVHWVLGSRTLRHPLVVITGVLIAFGLVLSLGQYALSHWVLRATNNAILNRYLDVGTISARTSALQIFMRVLPHHIVLGDGYTTAGATLETADTSSLITSDYFSHNAIVGLLESVGLPGLFAFGLFLYRWFWESLRTVNKSYSGVARSQLWIVSGCVGMLFTGALTGPLFLTSSYFLIFVGISMGEAIRLRQTSAAEHVLLALEINRLQTQVAGGREVRAKG